MPVSHQAVKVDKPSARYAFASSDYVAITKERIDEKDLLADEQQPAEGISEPILYDKRELKALAQWRLTKPLVPLLVLQKSS